jgi:hypothetical protein
MESRLPGQRSFVRGDGSLRTRTMIPIVDARSGRVIEVGSTVVFTPIPAIHGGQTEDAYTLTGVRWGWFSADATIRRGVQQYKVRLEIRWLPRWLIGSHFPVGGWRVAILLV